MAYVPTRMPVSGTSRFSERSRGRERLKSALSVAQGPKRRRVPFPPFLPPVAWGKVHGLVPGLRNPLMRHVSTLAAVLAVALVSSPLVPITAAAETTVADARAAESRKLNEIVEAYFEEVLKLNPLLATSIGDPRYNDRFEVTISPEWRARSERLQRDYLERIGKVDPALLAGQDALTYEIFRTGRQRDLEGFRFPGHLIPLNQFYSVPNSFAQLGSGSGMQPF